ncbi:MAG: RNA methyltransferase [Eubacterium sp.]|nr:RNA methyltransferase [Eubacterium sp.]
MITSTANQQVKHIMQLAKKAEERRKENVFLAEGVRIFEEMPKERLRGVYVSESFLKKDGHIKLLEGSAYETVSDAVFRKMSDTKTPQGILCIVEKPQYELGALLKGNAFLLVLEGIRDPGNLGMMLRTAEGAGVTGVIACGCADLHAPKTVRATMGSICRVPFYETGDLEKTLRILKEQGVVLYAAHLQGRNNYDELDYRGAAAFLIGSEAHGLADGTAAQADVYLKIPMCGQLESLNAAMAAGILMYEAARQRRS